MSKVKAWLEEHSQCDVCKGYMPIDPDNLPTGVVFCSPECEAEMHEVMEALDEDQEAARQYEDEIDK